MEDKSVRVLVVDDDASFVAALLQHLRPLGFEVTGAVSYMTALDMLEILPQVDLLLCDIVLDKGNGIALGRMAKRRHPKLRIIYLTGYDVASEALDSPVIAKPIPMDKLTDTIDIVLAASASGEE